MNDYRDCSAERARIAELLEYIECLEGQIACLERLVFDLKEIIREALLVAEDLARWLQFILGKTQAVLSRKSGIPRGVWSFAKGSDAVGRQALAYVLVIISILSRNPPDCDGGCD
jgi:hypothetical protein